MSKRSSKIAAAVLTIFLLLFHAGFAHASDRQAGTEQEVIVTYKNEAGKSAIIKESVNINHAFDLIPAISATVTSANIKALASDPNISYIERNAPIQLAEDDVASASVTTPIPQELSKWNFQAVQPTKMWDRGYKGAGVKVAVIDSGIAAHDELTIAGGISTVSYTSSYDDDNGHGTHVAGIIASKHNGRGIAGIAPDIELYAVKSVKQDGKGSLSDVMKGIEWSIQNKMDIINLSFEIDKDVQLFRDLLEQAYAQGIIIVAAAGNTGTTPVQYPAKYDSVIAVGSIDENNIQSASSSRGAELEFAAPGDDILSTYLNNRYGITSGTSQAAPHVTGMLALLKQEYPFMTNVQLREELKKHAIDLGAPGRDDDYGYGLATFAHIGEVPPAEVTNLQVTGNTETTLSLSWTNPLHAKYDKVHLYMNGEFVQSVTGTVYEVRGLAPSTTYNFRLTTVDASGTESFGQFIAGTTSDSISSETPVDITDPATGPNVPQAPVTTAPVLLPYKEAMPMNRTTPPSGGSSPAAAGGDSVASQPKKTQSHAGTTKTEQAEKEPTIADFMEAKFAFKALFNKEKRKEYQDKLETIKQKLGVKDIPAKSHVHPHTPISVSLQVAMKSLNYKYIDPSSIKPGENVFVVNGKGEVVKDINIYVLWNRIFVTPGNGTFPSQETFTLVIDKTVQGKPSLNSNVAYDLKNPLTLEFTTR
ncbi:S8 family serine peptidase [Paenibacillus apiarius]|uniref:S8 family serine peptidase n=1 Tax=Paenibacillus apiarius TaxID=46240 RepID=A0ABT4DNY1_9BACL|nr:S8 family serine peptidase [Paenibacillus apiarius]MCY9512961.1 S8 family serine peptidase [Paenibacillus apiarius]MCY9518945.1 S8 family serine peptidase [Paenibacillus apiarius]MCY9559812.1 S8 family serine peptidase [Paenibacillus apiarius]MCY9682055.1 S8 family serine peptidase [Paenibacillus apiarius]MCY9723529.1 S8 family serine peptidase [Paenibacillus apiarius]